MAGDIAGDGLPLPIERDSRGSPLGIKGMAGAEDGCGTRLVFPARMADIR
jgi:hypothetical protein